MGFLIYLGEEKSGGLFHVFGAYRNAIQVAGHSELRPATSLSVLLPLLWRCRERDEGVRVVTAGVVVDDSVANELMTNGGVGHNHFEQVAAVGE